VTFRMSNLESSLFPGSKFVSSAPERDGGFFKKPDALESLIHHAEAVIPYELHVTGAEVMR
jgi:hypothetical protein